MEFHSLQDVSCKTCYDFICLPQTKSRYGAGNQILLDLYTNMDLKQTPKGLQKKSQKNAVNISGIRYARTI